MLSRCCPQVVRWVKIAVEAACAIAFLAYLMCLALVGLAAIAACKAVRKVYKGVLLEAKEDSLALKILQVEEKAFWHARELAEEGICALEDTPHQLKVLTGKAHEALEIFECDATNAAESAMHAAQHSALRVARALRQAQRRS